MAMTHDELLKHLWEKRNSLCDNLDVHFALSAIVELHKPCDPVSDDKFVTCETCNYEYDREYSYPCETIQAIEKELL